MKVEQQNNENNEDKFNDLVSKLEIKWEKPKDEVWNKLSMQLKAKPVIQMKPKKMRWPMAVAAVFILAISLGIFMRNYSKDFIAPNGTHLAVNLPDGSTVNINAGSEISYNPYWWRVKRQIKLKGEAFFKVKKGRPFSVQSKMGTTEVLGTSFNVFAREQNYEVTCVTGKVKVKANTSENSVIIHPYQKASLKKTGQLVVKKNINIENTKAWISGRLVFTSMELIDVFQEIERQYNLKIILPDSLTERYTGSFDKTQPAQELLQLICRPYGFKIEKKGENKFSIIK